MKPVRAGALRNSVQFQSISGSAPDAAGQPSQTWTTYYPASGAPAVWASIDVLRGKMIYNTDDFVSESSYMMEIRFPPAGVEISAQDRAVLGGDTYVIDSVMDVEKRKRKLQILCHVLNEAD